MTAEDLMLGMASVTQVTDAFSRQLGLEKMLLASPTTTNNIADDGDNSDDGGSGDGVSSLRLLATGRKLDCFARTVKRAWLDDQFGPSKDYLESVVKAFMQKFQESELQYSEELMELLLLIFANYKNNKGSPSLCGNLPHPDEFCHLSFRYGLSLSSQQNTVDGDNSSSETISAIAESPSAPFLRVRVFPQHNDVGLRLWEAGAVLAEYLMAKPSLVRNKKVLELGSGVGLTALVVAVCGAKSVYGTDYSQAALENMNYNFTVNLQWIVEQRRQQEHHQQDNNENNGSIPRNDARNTIIRAGFLEWAAASTASFGDRDEENDCENNANKRNNISNSSNYNDDDDNNYNNNNRIGILADSAKALLEADILLAADVCYNKNDIPDLIQVVHQFLVKEDKTRQQRRQQQQQQSRITGAPTIATKQKQKVAIFGTILRNRSAFALFQNELKSRNIQSRVLLSPSNDDDELRSLANYNNDPPLIFPTSFVQPRSDVQIVMLTLDETTSRQGLTD